MLVCPPVEEFATVKDYKVPSVVNHTAYRRFRSVHMVPEVGAGRDIGFFSYEISGSQLSRKQGFINSF